MPLPPTNKKTWLIWYAFIAATALWLTACGKPTTTAATTTTSSIAGASPLDAGSPPPTATPLPSSTALSPALQYSVKGVGNNPQYICVPAQQSLYLRVIPHANYVPMEPPNFFPYNTDGSIVYDGSPAYYTKLRVRLSIQNTSAAWDYESTLETPSVIGDYSNYLTPFTGTTVTPSAPLSIPEYTDSYIYGSDPNDGLCTYWEKQLGKCSQISTQLTAANEATCAAGTQKVLISDIVSDYPCNAGNTAWCAGGTEQYVPDYQYWSITVEAETENTKGFTN